MDQDQTSTILVFRVGPFYFSVQALEVESILSPPPVTTIPFAPPSVAGSCLFRGKVAIIIDLFDKFGAPSPPDFSEGQFLFSSLSHGITAFWVDEVVDVSPATSIQLQQVANVTTDKVFDRYLLLNDKIVFHTDFTTLYNLKAAPQLAKTLMKIGHPLGKTPVKFLQQGKKSAELVSRSDHSSLAPQELLEGGSGTVSADAIDNAISTQESRPQHPTFRSQVLTAPARDVPTDVDELDAFDRSLLHRDQKARLSKTFSSKPEDAPPKTTGPARIAGFSTQPRRPHATGRQSLSTQPGKTDRDDRLSFTPFVVTFLGLLMLVGIYYLLWPSTSLQPEIKQIAIPVDNQTEKEVQIALAPSQPKRSTTDENDFLGPPSPSAELSLPPAEEASHREPSVNLPKAQDEVFRIETDEFALIVERSSTPQPQKSPALSPPPEAVKQPINGAKEQIHIVTAGDTLWHIAKKYLGDPYQYDKLAKMSAIRNPHLIYPGDKIRIIKKTKAAAQ